MPAAQRENIRVHPDTIATVALRNGNKNPTIGKLYDLSYNGLGVVSDMNNGIKEGNEVDIVFELIIGQNAISEQVHVKGKILDIIEYHNAFRYCVSIFPDSKTQRTIIEYVNKREEEILDSLKEQLKEYMA